jgi:hypothetical protein
VIVRNNIATTFVEATSNPTITFDHNLTSQQFALFDQATQKEVYYGAKYYAGKTVGDHNIFDTNSFIDVFVKYDPAHFAYNLNLRVPVFTSTSSGTDDPAVGAGNSVGAPSTDITGARRTVPYDLGAYKASNTTAAISKSVGGTIVTQTPTNKR